MRGVDEAWAELAESIRSSGVRLGELTTELDAAERADGFQSLLRALKNHLGRFEIDRDRPELVFFNGPRDKFFMDNPDFRYWVADIRGDRRYRISGTVGDAVYQSVTVYSGDGLAATATARIDSDDLHVDDGGRFALTLSPERPEAGEWLPLPDDAHMVWVRHFHHDAATDRLGDCIIEPLDAAGPAPLAGEEVLVHRLRRLARSVAMVPAVFEMSWRAEVETPNQLRHWSEMTGGAGMTEPAIHYLRGSWQLDPDEALLVEGPVVPCRYWNALLYSRYLNSLDFRSRPVSRTSGTARLFDGNYRFVIAAEDPGVDADWLDTEGRPFGLVVLRWLQPSEPVPLPSVRVVAIDELREEQR